jgi:hypothetical protein
MVRSQIVKVHAGGIDYNLVSIWVYNYEAKYEGIMLSFIF